MLPVSNIPSPTMNLLNDNSLERPGVVANCQMNRERSHTGSNGYAKEFGFDPLAVLKTIVAFVGNAPDNWRQAADVGIDGILTDFPFELRAPLRKRRN